jgi:hypothetical protein
VVSTGFHDELLDRPLSDLVFFVPALVQVGANAFQAILGQRLVHKYWLFSLAVIESRKAAKQATKSASQVGLQCIVSANRDDQYLYREP